MTCGGNACCLPVPVIACAVCSPVTDQTLHEVCIIDMFFQICELHRD